MSDLGEAAGLTRRPHLGPRGRKSAGQVALQPLLVQLAPSRLNADFSASNRLGASRDEEGEVPNDHTTRSAMLFLYPLR